MSGGLPRKVPDRLTSRSAPSPKPYPYTLKAHYLNDLFIHKRGNQYAQRTVVKSAWYGKRVVAAQHEFIVLHIEDPEIEGLRRCLAIDRNPPNTQSTTVSSFPIASDTFSIAYDGDLARLLRESHLTPHLELEEISFDSSEPLYLRELVTLVCHISMGHPRYNLLDTNCYWFAGLIWECLREMRPSARHWAFPDAAKRKGVFTPTGWRGTLGCVRFSSNPIQARNILRDLANLPWDMNDSGDESEAEMADDEPAINEPGT